MYLLFRCDDIKLRCSANRKYDEWVLTLQPSYGLLLMALLRDRRFTITHPMEICLQLPHRRYGKWFRQPSCSHLLTYLLSHKLGLLNAIQASKNNRCSNLDIKWFSAEHWMSGRVSLLPLPHGWFRATFRSRFRCHNHVCCNRLANCFALRGDVHWGTVGIPLWILWWEDCLISTLQVHDWLWVDLRRGCSSCLDHRSCLSYTTCASNISL